MVNHLYLATVQGYKCMYGTWKPFVNRIGIMCATCWILENMTDPEVVNSAIHLARTIQ